MKSYLEIRVPISFNLPWFKELREAFSGILVKWQTGYYHITMAFLDDTRNLQEVETIMHKYLDNANAVEMTFNKLDVFTANNGMQIIHLTTDKIPYEFQKLVNDLRYDICNTSTRILSEFRLHVTLGRIKEPLIDIKHVSSLIDKINFIPFTLMLNEVEYRVFRGRSIYKNTLH